jgi:hypothetical protein
MPLAVIAAAAYVFLIYGHGGSGTLRVTTTIPGADIYLGGVLTGMRTDTTLKAPEGRAIVTVRKDGYISQPEFVVVEVTKNLTNQVRFILRSRRDIITRDSVTPPQPVHEDVLTTGESVRTLPPAVMRTEHKLVDYAEKVAAPTETSEKPEVRKELPLYVASKEDERNSIIDSPLTGTQITVTSAGADGAEIGVNGSATEKKTPYTFRDLDRGTYAVRIHRAGYDAKPESVLVSLVRDYQSELVSFELIVNHALPRPHLTISTAPLAAGILVNGQPVGVGKVSLDKDYGNYRVEFAEVAGYEKPPPVTAALTEARPNADLIGEYKRLMGNAYVALIPSEDIGKFDGSKLRVYVDNELMVDSPKDPFDAALLGKILSGRRLLKVQYGDLTNEIHVDALDGEVSQIVFRVESFFSKRSLKLRATSGDPVSTWQQKNQKLRVLTIS